MNGLYQIKIRLRQKDSMFWALLFPLFLGTLFYFMFRNIASAELFQRIPVGLVNTQENEAFGETMKLVEDDDGVNLFKVKKYDTMQDALKALKKKKIRGIIDEKKDCELTVVDSKTDVSIIKTYIDQYKQNEKLIMSVAQKDPQSVGKFVEAIGEKTKSISLKNIELKGQDKDVYAQYFFALLGFVCMVFCSFGSDVASGIQADASSLGARRSVAPTSKLHQILTDFTANYLISCVVSAIVVAFCTLLLKIDFGNNIPLILLAVFIGNFVGMAAGLIIGVYVKGDQKKKSGANVVFFLTSSFLGGLQWGDITYVLEKHCPVINRINPATLIVNSFKSLAVFGNLQKYWINVGSLFLIGILMIGVSVVKLRRAKYVGL